MRKARFIAEQGGAYHVILKATGPQMLFTENADKRDFLSILERSARFSGVDVLSFALLDNHFHLLVMVPERESVPSVDSPEFRRRIEALYGTERAERLFARWELWEERGRGEEVALERDRLRKRMHDLGQFMKTLKEWHSRQYREKHGWEGTLWRGRYKSILVCESYLALRTLALYIAMNPVRAGIVKRGTDSPWTSFGQYGKSGSFGNRCHRALLRELARRTGAEGTDSIEKGFARAMTRAEEIPREAVRAKIGRGESLSLEEMLVCRVHALSNGRALGERQGIESVPITRKHPMPLAQCEVELFSATRVRGVPLAVA
ncbi:MAG: transposase [Kiritimatiellae bacterium]|nr:transposase [Kiritimatiellia bacterium]